MSDTVVGGRKRSAEMDTSKKTSGITMTNEYSGYQPPAGVWQLTDRVSADVAAEEFFSEYVVKRRPAVFSGSLTDEQWKGSRWTLPYLFRRAGSTMVTVEDRPVSADRSSGMGAMFLEMHYREFVSSLIAGETRYQLTNGDVQCSMSDLRDRNGFLSTVLQPLHTLAEEFPLRPVILGNLVPHQVALCQGHRTALQAPSSTLHHYFHDCLYMLVRGHLRFRLFPPTAIPLLRSSKCALKIHSNGLAVYLPAEKSKQKAACLRADGVPMIGLARMKRDNAERDLIEAEARLVQLRSAGAESKPEMAGELEQAVTVMKNCEQLVDVASDELQRYYSDYDEDAEAEGDIISIHDDDSEPESSAEPAAKLSRLSDDVSMTTAAEAESEAPPDEEVTMLEYWQANSYSVHLAAEDTDNADVLFAKCPRLSSASCLSVDLKPGEMLYLPASWLYEVTSVESESAASMLPADDSSTASHTAVNSGDTDRAGMMERSAADRDDVADHSQLGTDGSKLTSTQASVGGYTELPVAGDNSVSGGNNLSSDKTESATDAVNAESAKASGDETSAKEMERIPQAPDGDTIYQGENETSGGERASALETAEITTSVEPGIECSKAGNEVQLADGDKTLDKPLSENIEGPGPAVSSIPETLKSSSNVTSDEDDTDFLALAYLVHPPDGAAFDRPYLDDFWQCRWQRMDAEIRKMLRKSSRLASDVITLDSSSSSSEYDSSEYGEDDYEDSMASNSPIFVCEKRNSGGGAERESANDIVLDGNSSNAIVVGDEEDIDDGLFDEAVLDEVDEIDCSAEISNEGDKDADSSIVVCDGETSTIGSSQPPSEIAATPDRPPDKSGSSVPEMDSAPAACTPDASNVYDAGSGTMANGSTEVPEPLDKTDKAAAESEHVKDADVANGTCGVDAAN